MNFETWFHSKHPAIPLKGCEAVLKLAADGATVPFIARYRKEQTGNLDEVAIQSSLDAKEEWEKILKRQEFIVGEIENQKKLTPELKEKVLSTFQLDLLEDIYLPYKQKRKTKAALAKEAGLEPLADWIWGCGHGTETPQPGQTLEIWAFTFRNEEKGFKDAQAAIDGAQDILIERLSETQELRQLVRDTVMKTGCLKTGKGTKAKPNSKFDGYFDYHEPIQVLLEPQNSHRYLAIRRGWMEEELTLGIGAPLESDAKASAHSLAPSGRVTDEKAKEAPKGASSEDPMHAKLLSAFEGAAFTVPDSPGTPVLQKAARLALKAHVLPSIENEAHKALKEIADTAAIHVFAENVRKLLLASPFGPKAVLGVDPGIRTGCKVAVVDDSGKYLASTVMHLQSSGEKEKAKTLLNTVIKEGNIRAIAVGNGTAGRETETFIRGVLKESGNPLPVVMVNEAGASVYSASEAAREEFPDLDVTVRGAISIARRLQDPLAELVKIDPKSIGVGQYQHDVSPHSLKKSLDFVVDSCVNSVGVALNTASYHLLSHVSGIGPSLAKGIVEHRGSRGLFKSRQELLEVPRFTKKAFEQAAGFLRIPDGENPLDNTGVHPERYGLLEEIAGKVGKTVKDLMGSGVSVLKQQKELRDQVGTFTFDDMVRELEKPGRDPREGFVAFQYREDIHEVKDLQSGMMCPGIVTNVTNFGAFVDIGVHQDGLVHISQLADKFVKDPREVVNPGDRVQVRVLEVNLEKNQISLSMKGASKGAQEGPRMRQTSDRQPGRQPERHAHNGHGKGRPEHRDQPRADHRGDHRGGSSIPKPKAPQPAFNNPFASLASLKKDLKPRT